MNVIGSNSDYFVSLWQQLWQADWLQYPLYSDLNIQYQKEYYKESQFTDLSFVIEEDGLALLGVRMALRVYPDGLHELTGFGRPIYYLERPNSVSAWRQRAVKLMKTEVNLLVQKYSISSIVYRGFSSILSPLAEYLFEIGGTANFHLTQVIDLSVSEILLHQNIRKRYKGFINWGEKNLDIQLINSHNISLNDIDRFKKLHLHAAKRETRSAKTWDLQYDMVLQEEAFILFGYLGLELITGAFFNHSLRYCYYGVSASKRELFYKPLSHAVLWTAILHAKNLGCRLFEMGEQFYPNQGNPPPTPKELGISAFKKGFGGQTEVRLDVLWKR
jgi:hypothetical protein